MAKDKDDKQADAEELALEKRLDAEDDAAHDALDKPKKGTKAEHDALDAAQLQVEEARLDATVVADKARLEGRARRALIFPKKETADERAARKALEAMSPGEVEAMRRALDAPRERTLDERAEKEMRGRDNPDHNVDRVRPDHPERPEAEPFDEEAKRQWKEARNQHPTQISVPKIKDPVPEPEEIREPTPEELAAKAERGLVRRPNVYAGRG